MWKLSDEPQLSQGNSLRSFVGAIPPEASLAVIDAIACTSPTVGGRADDSHAHLASSSTPRRATRHTGPGLR
jgi:hypothetical protein